MRASDPGGAGTGGLRQAPSSTSFATACLQPLPNTIRRQLAIQAIDQDEEVEIEPPPVADCMRHLDDMAIHEHRELKRM